MLKIRIAVAFLVALATAHSQQPYDYYHALHLPHSPPLHPVFHTAPPTRFSCDGRHRGYYADVDAGCQEELYNAEGCGGACEEGGGRQVLSAYHFCWRQRLVSTDLCSNGTLFNEQFQVCDHFYNVRCGSPYEDL